METTDKTEYRRNLITFIVAILLIVTFVLIGVICGTTLSTNKTANIILLVLIILVIIVGVVSFIIMQRNQKEAEKQRNMAQVIYEKSTVYVRSNDNNGDLQQNESTWAYSDTFRSSNRTNQTNSTARVE